MNTVLVRDPCSCCPVVSGSAWQTSQECSRFTSLRFDGFSVRHYFQSSRQHAVSTDVRNSKVAVDKDPLRTTKKLILELSVQLSARCAR
eukprot:3618147-Amphidinium_carterae.1